VASQILREAAERAEGGEDDEAIEPHRRADRMCAEASGDAAIVYVRQQMGISETTFHALTPLVPARAGGCHDQ
jgi:hypothetical protein